MDWRVFAFTTAVGVMTGLLFGVAPAFRGTRLTPADALRDHSRGVVSGGGRFQIGHALVAHAGRALVRAGLRLDAVRAHAGRADLAGDGIRVVARAGRQPRSARDRRRAREPPADVHARPRGGRRRAGHRGRGHVVRDAGQRLDVEPRDQRARLRRQRAPRRAVQRRLAELLQDDGDAAARRPRYRRHRSRGRAERDHRQRSLREEVFQRRESDRPDLHDRRLQRALPDRAHGDHRHGRRREVPAAARGGAADHVRRASRRSARSIPARAS